MSDIKMTELEEIKETIENLKTGVFDRTTGTKELFLPMFESLITTIESQNKKIERLSTKISELTGDHIVKGYEIAIDKNNQQTEQLKKLNESIEKRLNSPDIESLKAITELKNEEIEKLKQQLDYEKLSPMQKASRSIDQLERLQNAHIQPKSPS